MKTTNFTALRKKYGYAATSIIKTNESPALGSFNVVYPAGTSTAITLASAASATVGRITGVVNRCPTALQVSPTSSQKIFNKTDGKIVIAPMGYVLLMEVANSTFAVIGGDKWKLL